MTTRRIISIISQFCLLLAFGSLVLNAHNLTMGAAEVVALLPFAFLARNSFMRSETPPPSTDPDRRRPSKII